MSDRGNTDRPTGIHELIDDAVGPDAQGSQSVEATPQGMPCERFAFKHPECLFDSVDQAPVEG